MSEEGELFLPGREPEVAPGVQGFVFDTPNGIYIPFIAAKTPGSGQVAAWLDTLPKDRRIVFPNVLSGKLFGMLKRRGFTESEEQDPMTGDLVKTMERKP